MRLKEIGDVMLAGAPYDDEIRKERAALSLKFVWNA
jgi:hypothetical protein